MTHRRASSTLVPLRMPACGRSQQGHRDRALATFRRPGQALLRSLRATRLAQTRRATRLAQTRRTEDLANGDHQAGRCSPALLLLVSSVALDFSFLQVCPVPLTIQNEAAPAKCTWMCSKMRKGVSNSCKRFEGKRVQPWVCAQGARAACESSAVAHNEDGSAQSSVEQQDAGQQRGGAWDHRALHPAQQAHSRLRQHGGAL